MAPLLGSDTGSTSIQQTSGDVHPAAAMIDEGVEFPGRRDLLFGDEFAIWSIIYKGWLTKCYTILFHIPIAESVTR